jgi:hypothetical protein
MAIVIPTPFHNTHGTFFFNLFIPPRPIHGGENRYYFKTHPFISLYLSHKKFIKISRVCCGSDHLGYWGRAKGAAIAIVASAV